MLHEFVGALGQVAKTIGTVVGIRHGTEEPRFSVERRVEAVEIRRYGPRIAAETTVDAGTESARTEGFRRLARYIFGGNTGDAKIAMTAPVAQDAGQKIAMTAPVAAHTGGGGGQSVIRFFMPSNYTIDTLPAPTDGRVRLVEVPGERVAALRFSGVASAEAIAIRTEELLNILERNGIEPGGEPAMWFYDPPWTLPFRRRNEAVVSLDRD